jgi:hypothetical protein
LGDATSLFHGSRVNRRSFLDRQVLTLTPASVLELTRFGVLLKIPVELTKDKSRTDPLGKAIVFLQAGWFMIKCIDSVAEGLPLSLLEVHVFAHVVLAFIRYLFWFKKPYDPPSPLALHDPEGIELCALLTLAERNVFVKGTLRDALNWTTWRCGKCYELKNG